MACVHCALQTNSVSCKQFSDVCTVCKCVFFCFLSLKPQLRERESWEREGGEGQTEKDKVCFCGRGNTYKVRRERSAQTSATSKNISSTLEDRTESTDENGSHGCNNTESAGRQTLKSRSVYFLLKCPKWKPGLPITHRLSEETNNKWHPESVSVQAGSAAESRALQGGGVRGQPWH